MSLYSVDSLEAVNCILDVEESEVGDEVVEKKITEISSGANALSSSRKMLDSSVSISKSLSQSSRQKKFKNDKKLGGVLLPAIVDAKAKSKTYLEIYRERTGVPIRSRIYSPEGSTLSTLGDTSCESIPDVDSRPATSTPRDDQSELSFYRRLIQQQPQATRSWNDETRFIEAYDCMRSVSDCGLGIGIDERRLSYRPYSIKDYECLTVSVGDRSLGPDPVKIRSKWEKLMRRTDYGDLASSCNRQNIVRRSELRKNFRGSTQEGKISSRIPTGARNAPRQSRRCSTKQMLTVHLSNDPKSSSVKPNHVGPLSGRSSGESLDVSSLEDLQRRHQNEKRVMDLLINRTLLR